MVLSAQYLHSAGRWNEGSVWTVVPRVGHLRRQQHVLEVGGRVVRVGPARRIARGL